MEYKASLDTLSKVITAGTFLLFVGVGYRSVKALLNANGDVTTILIHAAIILFLTGVLTVSFLFSPRSYKLTKDHLIINRPIGDIQIALSEIEEARAIQEGEMNSTVRTFGNGGLFGYYGKYHNPQLGHMKFYTTKRNNRVLVKKTDGKKIIISPDNDDLLNEMKSLRAANI